MRKYRIYIDETGNSDLKNSENPNHRYLSLTGVILNLEYVREHFFNDIENLKKKYFEAHPDEPLIFHRKEMMNKKSDFVILKDQSIKEKLVRQ